MPRYDFQSPGAMASEGITKFLAERAAMKRQALLDALAEQDLQHKWADQDAGQENARGQLGVSQGRLKVDENQLLINQAEQANLQAGREADDTRADVPNIPDEALIEQLAPRYQKYLRDTGNVAQPPSPKGSVSSNVVGASRDPFTTTFAPDSPQLPQPEIYGGSAKFREEQKRQADVAAIRENPLFKGTSGADPAEKRRTDALERALLLNQAGIKDVPNDLLGERRVQIISDQGAAESPAIGPNDPIANVGRAPQPPEPTVNYAGTDPKTSLPIAMLNRLGQNGKPVYFSGQEPYAGEVGPKPGPGESKVPQTLVAELNRVRDALTFAQKNRSWWGGKSADEQALEQKFNGALGAVFAYDPADTLTKEAAAFIANDPDLKTLPLGALLQNPKLLDAYDVMDITPAGIQDLDRLLNFARGIVGTK